jgi:hypothetical protein
MSPDLSLSLSLLDLVLSSTPSTESVSESDTRSSIIMELEPNTGPDELRAGGFPYAWNGEDMELRRRFRFDFGKGDIWRQRFWRCCRCTCDLFACLFTACRWSLVHVALTTSHKLSSRASIEPVLSSRRILREFCGISGVVLLRLGLEVPLLVPLS